MTTKTHGMTGQRNAAKSEVLDGTFSGRCTKEEKAAWVKVAQSRGMKLQQFIRSLLNAEANSILNPEECPACGSENFERFFPGDAVGNTICHDCGRD